MRVRLIEVTPRASGARSERERSVEVDALRVGRGTDNEVVVNELGVALHHASFRATRTGASIAALETNPVRVNGKLVADAVLGSGDVVQIGGTRFRVLEPGEGSDLALEVEALAGRLSEREALQRRSRFGIEGGWLTRRTLSWGLAALVAVAFGLAPLLGRLQTAWSSGTLTTNHAFLAHDCSSCHVRAFRRVGDAACTACHTGIAGHVREDVRVAALDERRCASCHLEHEGTHGLASIPQALCSSCHADLGARAPGTELRDAADFGRDHPPFQLSIANASGAPLRVAWSPQLEERSGLRFSHLRHVGQVVADRTSGEKRHLACGECHRPAGDGRVMQPIEFERHCQGCHGLTFDERLGAREAPHGDLVGLRRELREVYSAWALGGNATDPSLPATLRRRPGSRAPLSGAERQAAEAWVAAQVRKADRFLTEEPGPCATCHEVRPGAAPDGGSAVAPVAPTHSWLPKARFSHRRHAPFACRECHPAAAVYAPASNGPAGLVRPAWAREQARPYALYTPEQLSREHGLVPSEAASDVLIPDLDNCRRCHAGGRARPPRVASDCVVCHGFHREASP